MTQRDSAWEWNSVTGRYMRHGGKTHNPELTVEEKTYSRPIVIYGANGQELVRKDKPDKIPFGFTK